MLQYASFHWLTALLNATIYSGHPSKQTKRRGDAAHWSGDSSMQVNEADGVLSELQLYNTFHYTIPLNNSSVR